MPLAATVAPADYKLEGSGLELAPGLKRNYFDDIFKKSTQSKSALQVYVKSALLGLVLMSFPQASHAAMDGGPYSSTGVSAASISQAVNQFFKPGLAAPYFFTRTALGFS